MTQDKYPTHNEFRSDTFTVPTQEMIHNSLTTYGDSVYKEDLITLKLEQIVAELTGKEAALFCVSGTMSNQIGLRANLYQPPHSILCDYRAHIYLHEAGGVASLSQAMVHPVIPSNGVYLTVDDIAENFTPDEQDIHAAPTKVISLENTLHGTIMPLAEIERISDFAKSHNIKLHLDGARLWNASAETGVSIKQYCQYFDSVSLCLSKSLGAPMGSILVGSQSFINKANHFKKQNGGGIRQAGIITSMAIIAITDHFKLLKASHVMAKDVGEFCDKHGIILESPVHTNFVFIDFKAMKMDPELFIRLGEENNIKLMGNRIAFHFQNDWESVAILKQVILQCYEDSLVRPVTNTKSNKKLYNRVTK